MTDCIFCRIARGEIPCEFVWQDERALAFRDLNPQAPLHVLIIPREHLASARDLTEAHGPLLVSVARAAQAVVAEAGLAEAGFRLVTNAGPAAGQTVNHLHYHLLAGRNLGWPPG